MPDLGILSGPWPEELPEGVDDATSVALWAEDAYVWHCRICGYRLMLDGWCSQCDALEYA
jgi:rubrerythrin